MTQWIPLKKDEKENEFPFALFLSACIQIQLLCFFCVVKRHKKKMGSPAYHTRNLADYRDLVEPDFAADVRSALPIIKMLCIDIDLLRLVDFSSLNKNVTYSQQAVVFHKGAMPLQSPPLLERNVLLSTPKGNKSIK
jgi:hypothetical protein